MFYNNYGCIYDKGDSQMKEDILEEKLMQKMRQAKYYKKKYQEAQNIIKEVREYLDKHEIEEVYLDCKLYETQAYKDILEILDKENI